MMGIEPIFLARQANILPLNYTPMGDKDKSGISDTNHAHERNKSNKRTALERGMNLKINRTQVSQSYFCTCIVCCW